MNVCVMVMAGVEPAECKRGKPPLGWPKNSFGPGTVFLVVLVSHPHSLRAINITSYLSGSTG